MSTSKLVCLPLSALALEVRGVVHRFPPDSMQWVGVEAHSEAAKRFLCRDEAGLAPRSGRIEGVWQLATTLWAVVDVMEYAEWCVRLGRDAIPATHGMVAMCDQLGVEVPQGFVGEKQLCSLVQTHVTELAQQRQISDRQKVDAIRLMAAQDAMNMLGGDPIGFSTLADAPQAFEHKARELRTQARNESMREAAEIFGVHVKDEDTCIDMLTAMGRTADTMRANEAAMAEATSDGNLVARHVRLKDQMRETHLILEDSYRDLRRLRFTPSVGDDGSLLTTARRMNEGVAWVLAERTAAHSTAVQYDKALRHDSDKHDYSSRDETPLASAIDELMALVKVRARHRNASTLWEDTPIKLRQALNALRKAMGMGGVSESSGDVTAWVEEMARFAVTLAARQRKTAVRDGYQPLADILDDMLEQGSTGKGHQRHSKHGGLDQRPWADQKSMRVARIQNHVGGLVFQICKKAHEAEFMDDPTAMYREALGIGNYAALLAQFARENMAGLPRLERVTATIAVPVTGPDGSIRGFSIGGTADVVTPEAMKEAIVDFNKARR